MGTRRPPTIVAMGGGGFSMEPDNPRLDLYALERTQVERPAVCLLPTASGDDDDYVDRFHAAFASLGAATSDVRLPWRPAPEGPPEAGEPAGPPSVPDLGAHLAAQDLVYVGGGNTRRMLAVWRHHGLDRILHALWHEGSVVLAGVSAGALCWFEEGVTDSVPGRLTPMRGLGWLPGSHCPHYDGEPGRRPAYEALVAAGRLAGGVAADDGCALHYEGRALRRVVASRPQAAAWRVRREAGAARCERLSARLLEAPR
jgi:peptidase E